MNKIILMGRLTKDVELENYGETLVGRFTLAVGRKGKKDETDFINCTAFNGTATNIQRYFGKGNLIVIAGRLQINKYTDKNGEIRTAHSVIVEEFGFCGERKKDVPVESENVAELLNDDDDSLPF